MPKEKENEIELIELQPTEEDPISKHKHVGSDAPRISVSNLSGLIETTDEFWTRYATSKPGSIYGQIKISVSGTTASLCIYNHELKDWRCILLNV